MATGYYDANGIWRYGESDSIALFSDLLNLGQASNSAAISSDRSRISFLEQSVEQSSTFVASSQAARDSYWGVPSTGAAQLALQNKGARTVRTDLGYTEQYFAAYNASTNPGGRVEGAGWTPIRRQDGLVPMAPTSVVVATGTATQNYLGTIAISGATSIGLNGVFTSEFRNYRVMLSLNFTVPASIYGRLNTSTTPNTSTNYFNAISRLNTNGATGALYNNGVSNFVFASAVGWFGNVTLDVMNPQVSDRTTTIHTSGLGNDSAYIAAYTGANTFNSTTSFDGFTIYPTAGNMSGYISVYGYND